MNARTTVEVVELERRRPSTGRALKVLDPVQAAGHLQTQLHFSAKRRVTAERRAAFSGTFKREDSMARGAVEPVAEGSRTGPIHVNQR